MGLSQDRETNGHCIASGVFVLSGPKLKGFHLLDSSKAPLIPVDSLQACPPSLRKQTQNSCLPVSLSQTSSNDTVEEEPHRNFLPVVEKCLDNHFAGAEPRNPAVESVAGHSSEDKAGNNPAEAGFGDCPAAGHKPVEGVRMLVEQMVDRPDILSVVGRTLLAFHIGL